jgi:hypothetical protein
MVVLMECLSAIQTLKAMTAQSYGQEYITANHVVPPTPLESEWTALVQMSPSTPDRV